MKENKIFLHFLLLFSILWPLSALWSGSPAISFFEGARIFLTIWALIGVIFFLQRSQKLKFFFYQVLIGLGIVESLIAVGQFFKRASLGFYFLGESHLETNVVGLPRIIIGGEKWLRAFGTLPHPNVLGGFLLLTLVATGFLYFYDQRPKKNFYFWLIFTQLVGLALTFSRSAWLGLGVILVFEAFKNGTFFQKLNKTNNFSKIFKTVILSAMLFFGLLLAIRQSSIESVFLGRDESSRLRFELAKAALKRFSSAPILGRGWMTGTIELPAFSNYSFYLWEYQPVHNIFLLVLADLGLIGLLVFLIFLWQVGQKWQKIKGPFLIWGELLSAYLLIGLFDHYLLTLPQGLFIFFLVALTCLMTDKKEEKVELKKKLEKIYPSFEK